MNPKCKNLDTFSTQREFDKHIQDHIEQNCNIAGSSLKCMNPKCKNLDTFSTQREFDKHIQDHIEQNCNIGEVLTVNPVPDIWRCEKCAVRFYTDDMWYNHVVSGHALRCRTGCGLMLPDKDAWRKHLEEVHHLGKNLMCVICLEVFDNKAETATHMAKHCQEAHRFIWLKCKKCKVFLNSADLWTRHMQSASHRIFTHYPESSTSLKTYIALNHRKFLKTTTNSLKSASKLLRSTTP
eukprot:431302_1